ncbi:MAG TPA: AI-2E family transporter, partial [Kofleriaceae bacterium]
MDHLIEAPPDVEREQHSALRWAALAAIVVIFWLIKPIGVGVLLGAFLAFMTQPLFERIKPRLGQRGSALAIVLGSGAALTAAIGGLGWLFITEGTALAGKLMASLQPGGAASGALHTFGRLAERLGVSQDQLVDRARAYAGEAATRVAGIAAALFSATGSALLGLFFALLSMHFILRNWQFVTRRAQQMLPLRPDYTAALIAEFHDVGRTTLVGAVGTGIAQGALATIGYWIAGVPEPLFFGAATTIASFVPAVGTLLVSVPIGIALVLVGDPGRGAIELVWALVVVVGAC